MQLLEDTGTAEVTKLVSVKTSAYLKRGYYEKYSREEILKWGADPKDPGVNWDEDLYEECLNAYQSGGYIALGEYFQVMISSYCEQDLESFGSLFPAIAKQALETVDWQRISETTLEYLQAFITSSTSTEDFGFVFNGTEHEEQIWSIIEFWIDCYGNPEDNDESDEFLERVQELAQEPEEFKKYVKKRWFRLTSDYCDYEAIAYLAKSQLSEVDWEEVGVVAEKLMKLDKTIRYRGL
jgi:hypothetical protein